MEKETFPRRRLGRLLLMGVLLGIFLVGLVLAYTLGPNLLFRGFYRTERFRVESVDDTFTVTERGHARWTRLPGPRFWNRTVPEARIEEFFRGGHPAVALYRERVKGPNGGDSCGDLEIAVPSGEAFLHGQWSVRPFPLGPRHPMR